MGNVKFLLSGSGLSSDSAISASNFLCYVCSGGSSANSFAPLVGLRADVFWEAGHLQHGCQVGCRVVLLMDRGIGQGPVVDGHPLHIVGNFRLFERCGVVGDRALVVALVGLGHASSIQGQCLAPRRDEPRNPFHQTQGISPREKLERSNPRQVAGMHILDPPGPGAKDDVRLAVTIIDPENLLEFGQLIAILKLSKLWCLSL